ncbi:MAG: hypothetical protein ACKVJG_10255 [Candidatus Latescibacterota bacterium]
MDNTPGPTAPAPLRIAPIEILLDNFVGGAVDMLVNGSRYRPDPQPNLFAFGLFKVGHFQRLALGLHGDRPALASVVDV